MASLGERLIGKLRALRRRTVESNRSAIVDVHGVVTTFSSIEIVGPRPEQANQDSVRAALTPTIGSRISDIDVKVTESTYRFLLPMERLALLKGDRAFTLSLETPSQHWRLVRPPTPARRSVSLPSAVYHHDGVSVRLRVTSSSEGAITVHSCSLTDVA